MMYQVPQVTDSVYYVGVNDRSKSLFENMWPLPYGVSYNSYLIVDEKVALMFAIRRFSSRSWIQSSKDALSTILSSITWSRTIVAR